MAAALVRQLLRWRSASYALLYWPVRGEIDTRTLMADLWGREAEVWLPRCRHGRPGAMDLARLSSEDQLVPGVFAIPEPGPECRLVKGRVADVALIPGVGFDRRGFRIGYGGGYYDRLLADPEWDSCLKVGLAHEFQLLDELPHDDWDRPVDLVVTPESVIGEKS